MAQLTQDTRSQLSQGSRSHLTQDTRIGVLETPLGKDVLVLVRFDGTEGLSELFEYRIECLSEEADINFDRAIGQQCTLKVKTYPSGGGSSPGGMPDDMLQSRSNTSSSSIPRMPSSSAGGGNERQFSGILVEAQWLGVKNDYFSYRIVLRPWFWLLSRTTDCRIFLDKKVDEIIKEVFQDRGFNDHEFKLSQDYPKLEMCVQYRETDMNFISRIMEQHGIYYFFRHEGGKHMMVLADSRSSHKPVPNHATIPYIPLVGDDRRKEEHIYEWVSERRFRTGKVELNDYNYEKPSAEMKSDANGSESYTRSSMEFYDYPGKYKEKSDGEKYAKWQLQAEQALDHRRHGNGDAISLFPGGLTKLENHAKDSQNVEYLILRASHSLVVETYRSGGGGAGAGEIYYGSYEFLPSDRPFRAPVVTPKPLIHGIQTAKVVTKDDGSSEEIDVEKLTEIYVRFYWDRKKKRSCKVRCAQVWSGKKWGGQFIPRVGQEAVIEFLEGDPDRPLVVGTVYNDEYKPPYDLPGKKTIAGIKSDSSKGGGGYNEWNFEDKKGAEVITVHAEKDLETTILNKETRTIGERFMPPMGAASRETTLKMGDDVLTIKLGNQTVTLPLGKQETTALQNIHETVIATDVQLQPMMHMITTPMITHTGQVTVNINAGLAVTITAPFINLNGLVLINGMVPVCLPA